MSVKLSADMALSQLDKILADIDVQPDPEQRQLVLKALIGGRLEWDPAEQRFTYELINPIKLENGERITKLSFNEPDAGQMKKAAQAHDPFDQMLRLVSYCSDQPVGYIERLKARDLNVSGSLVAFFK